MHYKSIKEAVCKTALEIYKSNLVIGTWGNVSSRIDDDLCVITPSGLAYDSLTAKDMVVVNSAGTVIEGDYIPSIETPLHTAIYQARPDAKAIVHVHSPYATAFAVANREIPLILEETAQVIGHPVRVAAYAICGSQQLAEEAISCLLNGEKAILLANHGLVAVEENLSKALKVCFIAEKTAMIAINALKIGSINPLSAEDTSLLNEKFKSYGQEKK